jgi:hypothetical protein
MEVIEQASNLFVMIAAKQKDDTIKYLIKLGVTIVETLINLGSQNNLMLMGPII